MKLTQRQRQVFNLLCDGYSYKGAAYMLKLSENTVKHYIKVAVDVNKISKLKICYLLGKEDGKNETLNASGTSYSKIA